MILPRKKRITLALYQLFIHIFISFLVSFALLAASIGFVPRLQDLQKSSPYECGFDPYASARVEFELKFQAVAVLFLVFDLELAIVAPFSLVFGSLSSLALWGFSFFFIFLILGYLYEWQSGFLDW